MDATNENSLPRCTFRSFLKGLCLNTRDGAVELFRFLRPFLVAIVQLFALCAGIILAGTGLAFTLVYLMGRPALPVEILIIEMFWSTLVAIAALWLCRKVPAVVRRACQRGMELEKE